MVRIDVLIFFSVLNPNSALKCMKLLLGESSVGEKQGFLGYLRFPKWQHCAGHLVVYAGDTNSQTSHKTCPFRSSGGWPDMSARTRVLQASLDHTQVSEAPTSIFTLLGHSLILLPHIVLSSSNVSVAPATGEKEALCGGREAML